MRSIQEVGMEILSGNPKKFYIFCGPEYGVKLKYIQYLKDHYDGHYESYDSVQEVLDLMKVKRIIPLVPSVYVVRYDESYVSSLNDKSASQIDSSKIIGTLVCLYDNPKTINKIDKYLGDYSVIVSTVSSEYLKKYLHQDFAGVADKLVDIAVECGSDYYQSKLICAALKSVNASELLKEDKKTLYKLFGHESESTEAMLRKGIAAKNFNYCMKVLEDYDGYDTIYYTILQTLVEIDKCMSSKYAQSDIQKFVKMWSPSDVYNMFDITYSELKRSRSMSIDLKSSIVYLLSILAFKPIPRKEALGNGH